MYPKVVLTAVTALLVVLAALTSGSAAPLDDLEKADRLFTEKSYKPALELYRAVYTAEEGQSDRRGHAMLRIARCLRRVDEFDRAIGFLDEGVPSFQGSIWRGRALGLRGQISLTMPHYYYKKGDEISRTNWIQGATYHYTYYDDLIAAMTDLEEAVKLLDGTPRVKSLSDEERARRSSDLTQACVDMATALETHRGQKGGLVGLEPHSQVKADYTAHSIGRHFGTDPQTYFNLASKAAASISRSDDAAFADYLEAMYCRRLLESFRVTAKVGADGSFEIYCRIGGTDEKPQLVKLPEASDPFRLFEAFAKNHAKSSLLDDTIYAHAATCNQFERYVEALALVDRFAERFPKSRWRSDVANLVQQITHPVIEMGSPPAVLPGEPQQLEVTTRNVAELTVEVHRIDFDGVFGSRTFLDDDDASLSNVQEVIDAVGLRRVRSGAPVLSLKPATGDEGKHQRHTGKVRLDLPGPGAFLIEARGPETTMRTLALVSNLAMIRKVSDDRTIVVVTDATTGLPIENAAVTVRQKHRAKGIFGSYDKITWTAGKTDADGLYTRPHAASSGRQISIEAFASHAEHPAITRFGNAYPRGKSSERLILYGFTDRPVYRPAEETHFVGSLRTRRDGDYENWAGNRIGVTIRDPKNNVIFDERLETDDFGAVSGRIVLGEEPPLGVYNIQYRNGKRFVGRTTFRVEEYKKPEFEVSVSGPEEPVRVGDVIPIKILGEYYFGGGVGGATVKYRIHRRGFAPNFRIDEPYAWLYGRRRGFRPPRHSGLELLLQGEGTTDEDGVLKLSVPTEELGARLPDQDHELVIEADVTDISRRTISGGGTAVVPRRGLFARLDADRGFYRAGDGATLTVRTQTPAGAPAASKGTIVVSRVTTRTEGEKVVETLTQISADEFAIDESGAARFPWRPDSPGRFAVRYVTSDRWGEPVVGELRLWVTAPDHRAQDFHFKNIEIITDKTEYRPGETAFVLLNSAFEDTAVFVTLEADRQVLYHDVVRLSGRTRVLTIPIREEFAPNVHLHAMCARNGRFYEHVQEVFVPPSHEFMDVDLAFDQAQYLPGGDARLTVECRDRDGRPLDAQFALRVMDESITYIQQDTTPDVRKFFYGAKRSFHGTGRWNANTINSLQFAFRGYLVRNRKWKDYRNHGMPRGWYLNPAETWGADSGLADGMLKLDAEESEPLAEATDDARYEGKDKKVAGRARRALGSKREMAPAASAKPMARDNGDAPGEVARPDLRENFSTLANWTPALRTGDDGKAEITFRFPDSLTNWIATARGMTRDTIVGAGEAEARTTKRVLARLQAPRFFTERDEIVLSGVVRNDYEVALPMKVELAIDGDAVVLDGDASKSVTVAAGEQLCVDWTARVVASGEIGIRLSALSSRESDAMAMRFPVLAYGIDKVVTEVRMSTGGDDVIEIPVVLPEQRRISSTALEVTLSPSLASTMLDALPYLVEYPYGCTEQTTSRFLPAVMVAKTLKEMGVSLEDVARKREDLANREGLDTRGVAPVYSSRRLEQIVKAGIRRLSSMQNSDGGFGWWARDHSSVHLSAYVVYGLAEAKSAGFDVPARVLDRGVKFLEREIGEISSLPEIGFATFALAAAGKKHAKALDHVFAKRDDLSTMGKAQLALSLHLTGDGTRAATVVRNLGDFVQHDRENGTCHWAGGRSWWRWYADEVETNAWVLLALSRIDAKSELNEPLSRWLVRNRSGNRWKSTRDTAACVLALCSYMRGAGELTPDYAATVSYADLPPTERRVSRDNMFAFDNRIVFEGDALRSGSIPLHVSKKGTGKLYVTTRLIYFSQEDKITAAGHEIEVSRRYYRLEPYETTEKRGGREVKVIKHERTLLEDLATVPAGAEIEVVLNVTARNDYEYIMVEDRKPAGFEPVALRSGRRYGNGVCSNMELRDERVVFFVTWLQQGSHEISYRMRAESPGKLNAMPCKAVAMYAPRLGGISDSWRVKVVDRAN